MSSTSSSQDPTSSPHSKSLPISIQYPDKEANKPTPHILQNGDAAPSISQIPKPNITDYTPAHYSKTAQPSNAQFEATNPMCLGQTVPLGFVPKPPPRKDLGLRIVPEWISPRRNVRDLNRRLWAEKEMVERIREAAQKTIAAEKKRSEKCAERTWNESVTAVAISFV
ncbi:uncharacterized protein M421DRAFT_3118 [Didymella exigua CBS 183.55]|uniref:Uncharacterized protein n=1 Tax=Didymella exigua CBS 183.55 TaxID=1150837 RepID=A0A6A5RQW2_9PLEO|nr:uncharacterized protein M421DRAFT_3118 [Didymella exigua CBS 183.55]KAF1930831.1 hypothetical protein M421DRAFT_3118 [Didymella exigua CBS 183.55]